jgi:nitrogen-specific signal transduction histidine kinase
MPSTIKLEKRIKELEEENSKLFNQLKKIQINENIANLTSMITHDLNNILTIIVANTEMLKYTTNNDSNTSDIIENIFNACDRGSQINNLVLSNYNNSDKNKIININSIIKDCINLISPCLNKLNIKYESNLESRKKIIADETLIYQILQNLTINARDAIKENGLIKIITKDIILSSKYNTKYSTIPQGEYVLLSFNDSGTGIKDEYIEKILEQGYTTKGEEGSGLGLSIIKTLMEKYKGHIHLNSKHIDKYPNNHGTTFDLYFPIKPINILAIDDDELILNLIKRCLTNEGYNVKTTLNYQEGLNLLKQQEFDLGITDIVVKSKNGIKLLTNIKKIAPNMPIYLISGEPCNNITSLIEAGASGYIKKPFSINDLKSSIDKELSINIKQSP